MVVKSLLLVPIKDQQHSNNQSLFDEKGNWKQLQKPLSPSMKGKVKDAPPTPRKDSSNYPSSSLIKKSEGNFKEP